MSDIYIGCAGWSINALVSDRFPSTGTHLERYGQVFRAVEINSSFYRHHQAKTYEKWAASVPADFRFSVKVPRAITHDLRLRGNYHDTLGRFAFEAAHLGEKLGPMLVQLPPSLAFESSVVGNFLADLRRLVTGPIVWEPRHKSWAAPEADALLRAFQVARVAADPARFTVDHAPGGDDRLAYYRWHGSPELYKSSYTDEDLTNLTNAVTTATLGAATMVWVIFDNTQYGHAIPNALQLMTLVDGALRPRTRSAVRSDFFDKHVAGPG